MYAEYPEWLHTIAIFQYRSVTGTTLGCTDLLNWTSHNLLSSNTSNLPFGPNAKLATVPRLDAIFPSSTPDELQILIPSYSSVSRADFQLDQSTYAASCPYISSAICMNPVRGTNTSKSE